MEESDENILQFIVFHHVLYIQKGENVKILASVLELESSATMIRDCWPGHGEIRDAARRRPSVALRGNG